MKIAVFSDTHNEVDKCLEVLNKNKDINLIIHLGDNSSDVDIIKKHTEIEIINVKGNCDINLNIEDEKVLEIKGVKIFITHGHKYGVKTSLNSIYYRAKELNANIVLFGHSHIPINVLNDNVLLLNPGSITLPKGGHKKSFGLIEITDSIKSKIVKV